MAGGLSELVPLSPRHIGELPELGGGLLDQRGQGLATLDGGIAHVRCGQAGLAANLGETGQVGLGLDRKTLLLGAQGLGDRHQPVAAGIEGAFHPADMV